MGNTENKEREGQIEYERFGAVAIEEMKDPENDQEVISFMKFSRSIESENSYKNWIK